MELQIHKLQKHQILFNDINKWNKMLGDGGTMWVYYQMNEIQLKRLRAM